jgi:Holliday junction resolvase-like predicted endonuclease
MKRQRRTKSRMDSVMKGNTGEFYALAELSRRGWTAAQTARNTRIYDILARKDEQQVTIRVKTKTSDAGGFNGAPRKMAQYLTILGRTIFVFLSISQKAMANFRNFILCPRRR